METAPIVTCSHADFMQILENLEAFWGSTRTLTFHHPMFLHEFGNTSYVIKENGVVIAYLFGFLSQTEQSGYVHLVGVRQPYQNKGLGKKLYTHFIAYLKKQGIENLKAITTVTNETSIRFHVSMGMQMIGEETEKGMKIVKDYSGPGQDRVVFKLKID